MLVRKQAGTVDRPGRQIPQDRIADDRVRDPAVDQCLLGRALVVQQRGLGDQSFSRIHRATLTDADRAVEDHLFDVARRGPAGDGPPGCLVETDVLLTAAEGVDDDIESPGFEGALHIGINECVALEVGHVESREPRAIGGRAHEHGHGIARVMQNPHDVGTESAGTPEYQHRFRGRRDRRRRGRRHRSDCQQEGGGEGAQAIRRTPRHATHQRWRSLLRKRRSSM